MAELAEDKGDLVAEQSRGVIQALGKRIDGVDGVCVKRIIQKCLFHDPVGKTLWNRAQLLKEDA